MLETGEPDNQVFTDPIEANLEDVVEVIVTPNTIIPSKNKGLTHEKRENPNTPQQLVLDLKIDRIMGLLSE